MSTAARADGAAGIDEALRQAQWIVDVRLRSEEVDQAGIDHDAQAITLRARVGLETGALWSTSLLVEGEAVVPLDDRYRPDPLDSYHAEYPVVADPESFGLNRVQLTNTALPDSTISFGRQRVLLDDQRFVGNVGWRQNEQTVDALRIVNKSLQNVVVDATLFNRVNRVFGEDSPQGTYRGDGILLNVGYQAAIGRLAAFGYRLDFDPIAEAPAAAEDSSATWGLRLEGDLPVGAASLSYLASWATQSEAGANPLSFDLDYASIELAARYQSFRVAAGLERLDGNGEKGFTTPLATLHKFQGWADKFLATPVDGVEDTYASAGYDRKGTGAVDRLELTAAFHDYRSEQTSANYGSEWNVSVAAQVGKFNLMLKYAEFREGVLASARDTTKFWIQVAFVA